MRYMGVVKCKKCGMLPIQSFENISVWYTPDAEMQYAVLKCPKCKFKTKSFVSTNDVRLLHSYGCDIRRFNDLFSPLTEDSIEKWDVEGEFQKMVENEEFFADSEIMEE